MPVETRTADIEPTTADLDRVVDDLKSAWKSSVTVRRQSKQDIGYRDIFVLIDDEEIAILHHGDEVTKELAPGAHRLKVHNTLFKKALDFTLNVGEHASFMAINRAGFGTYSVLAFFIGGGPIYLSLERDSPLEGGRT